MTAWTIEDPDIQGHLLPMSAGATGLTRISRVNSKVLSPSFFRFGEELAEKFRPRGIGNAFGKAMVMGHAVHVKVFYRNHPETVYDLAALLMGEVVPSERNPLMNSGNYFAMLAPLRRPLSQLAMLALHFCQGFLFLAKEARVANLFTGGERGKGLQAYVYPYLLGVFWQAFRFALTREGHVPFSCRTTLHGTGFHLALDRPVVDHLDTPNLGKGHTVIMGGRPGDGENTEARLGKGEGVISLLALETWKARFLSMFSDTSEECLESQINTYRHILKDLRMHATEGGTFLFQDREGVLLLKTGEGDAIAFIGCLTHLQQVVIEPTTLFKGVVELLFLLLRWIDAILEHFQHIRIVAQTEQEGKRGAALYLSPRQDSPAPNRNAAFIPMDKSQGLSAAGVGKEKQ